MKYIVIGLILFWYLIISSLIPADAQTQIQYPSSSIWPNHKFVVRVGGLPSYIDLSKVGNAPQIGPVSSLGQSPTTLFITREYRVFSRGDGSGGNYFINIDNKITSDGTVEGICSEFGQLIKYGASGMIHKSYGAITMSKSFLTSTIGRRASKHITLKGSETTIHGQYLSPYRISGTRYLEFGGNKPGITFLGRCSYPILIDYPRFPNTDIYIYLSFPVFMEMDGTMLPDPVFPPPPNDPMCSGYIPSTDTFKAVMSETKAKIEATPIATLARLTINLSPPPCPVWKVPDVLGFGGFEINVQCSSIMTSYIYPMMKLTIFMASGMASIRMSIL